MTSIAERISDELLHQHDAAARPQLSFDAALRFLRQSRTTIEARRAGEILRRSVAAETESVRSDAAVPDDVRQRVRDLSQLLRQAKSPYEVRVAAAALRQAIRSAAPPAAEAGRSVEDTTRHTDADGDGTLLRTARP